MLSLLITSFVLAGLAIEFAIVMAVRNSKLSEELRALKNQRDGMRTIISFYEDKRNGRTRGKHERIDFAASRIQQENLEFVE